MKNPVPKPKERLALLRFEVVCHIKTLRQEGRPLAECVRAAALRPWPAESGQYFAARTIETWWYNYAKSGYGGLAGFTTMVANAGGAPMSLYLLAAKYEKWRFIGTGAWFFFAVNAIKLPISIGLGIIGAQTVVLWASVAPIVLLGTWLGRVVIKKIDQGLFEGLVTASVAASALYLAFF